MAAAAGSSAKINASVIERGELGEEELWVIESGHGGFICGRGEGDDTMANLALAPLSNLGVVVVSTSQSRSSSRVFS